MTTRTDQENIWHMGEDARNVTDQTGSQILQAAAEHCYLRQTVHKRKVQCCSDKWICYRLERK